MESIAQKRLEVWVFLASTSPPGFPGWGLQSILGLLLFEFKDLCADSCLQTAHRGVRQLRLTLCREPPVQVAGASVQGLFLQGRETYWVLISHYDDDVWDCWVLRLANPAVLHRLCDAAQPPGS